MAARLIQPVMSAHMLNKQTVSVGRRRGLQVYSRLFTRKKKVSAQIFCLLFRYEIGCRSHVTCAAVLRGAYKIIKNITH